MLQQYRHVYLLASLVFLLGGSPVAHGDAFIVGVFDLFVLVTAVGGVAGVATNRRQILIGGLLALAMGASMVYNTFDTAIELSPVYPLLGLTFYGYLTVMLSRHVFGVTKTVTTDTICGAISIYLLLGVLFTFFYAGLESVLPGSFNFPHDPGRAALNPFQRLLGFSFITLTTLGYGNISPANHLSDMATSAEALAGQIYMTVLVARLVALQITSRSSREDVDAG